MDYSPHKEKKVDLKGIELYNRFYKRKVSDPIYLKGIELYNRFYKRKVSDPIYSELPPAPGATQLLMQTAPDLELVVLRDYEWKVFNEGE